MIYLNFIMQKSFLARTNCHQLPISIPTEVVCYYVDVLALVDIKPP